MSGALGGRRYTAVDSMSQPVTHTIEVQCSVRHAFNVFTERLDLWWPPGHRKVNGRLTMEARVGGQFYELDDSGERHALGRVTRWEPPHRVGYTWLPGADAMPTQVDVEFLPQGPATVVRVVHGEGGAALGSQWPVRAKKFDAAWRDLLPDLQAFIDHNPEHPRENK